jgi:transglutaminase-like putative cysteine protease
MAHPQSDELSGAEQPPAQHPGETGGEEDKVKPHQRFFRSKGFIPSVVVVVLAVFVLLSPRMAGSPPRLESITPSRAKPGDVMILSGRNFGGAQEGSEVRISGVSPTSRDYTEWTDARISLRIPEETGSGIVYVLTKSGRSGGLLFISQNDIPQPSSGSTRPGDPYFSTDTPIQPSAARVGDTITIYGLNFGLEKGSSEVFFTWSGLQASSGGSLDPANRLPARDYDFDYLSWSDREIKLRVPQGAASGNVMVRSDKGTSNAAYFVVNKGAGSTTYTAPRKYSVQYALAVSVSAASGENTLSLWIPRVFPGPEQRSLEAVALDPAPLLDTTAASLYTFTNLQKGGKYRVSMSWMFDRYEVQTQVSTYDVPPYVTTSALFAAFTAPDILVPSANPDVIKAAAGAVGGERNPWLKARRIYDWLLSQLSYSPNTNDTLPGLRARRGNAFVFSSLYCAMLRASGIPARMVSGYLVGEPGQPARRHYWDELYLETVGWIPVDPAIGEEKSLVPGSPPADFDGRSWYFGNLDNRHITFTKGLQQINQLNPAGVVRHDRSMPYLLTIDEEAVGGLGSYSTSFEDLTVTGTY